MFCVERGPLTSVALAGLPQTTAWSVFACETIQTPVSVQGQYSAFTTSPIVISKYYIRRIHPHRCPRCMGFKLGLFRDSEGQENKNRLQKRVSRQKTTLVVSLWCKSNPQRPHTLDISPCAKMPRSGSSSTNQSTFLDDRTLKKTLKR